jgi:hypothetical protein
MLSFNLLDVIVVTVAALGVGIGGTLLILDGVFIGVRKSAIPEYIWKLKEGGWDVRHTFICTPPVPDAKKPATSKLRVVKGDK